MSVLVKGMEKPEHCGYCRFRYGGICHALQKTQYSMDECPLVGIDDVKEIIRCKDCKYVSVEPCKDYENVYVCDRNYWTRAQGGNMPNDFCSKGERREE